MLLSEIIVLSLNSLQYRKTMLKKTNPNPQMNKLTAHSMQLKSRASNNKYPP